MHKLATELIKATGLDLKEPEKFQVTHVNCSHSQDANPTTNEEFESVVIKTVLEKKVEKYAKKI